jgi:ABC-type polysaccharide/polyol phosphate export permease
LNPMYHLIQIFRMPIYEGKLPASSDLLISVIISLITLTTGWYIFSKKSSRIAYYA